MSGAVAAEGAARALKVLRLLPGGHPETGLAPSHVAEPGSFTTDDHTELAYDFFLDEVAGISAGVWTCAPSRSEIAAYPVHEMMTVLSGSVTVTNADGTAETFTAGDTFFITKGTPCIWEITERLTKYYMIVE